MMKAFIRGFFATLLVIALVVGFMVWTSHMMYVNGTQAFIEISLFLSTVVGLICAFLDWDWEYTRGKYER